MAEFSEGLEVDLLHVKQAMSEHTQAMNSYFDGVMSHAELLKVKVQGSFEVFSDEFQVNMPCFVELPLLIQTSI